MLEKSLLVRDDTAKEKNPPLQNKRYRSHRADRELEERARNVYNQIKSVCDQYQLDMSKKAEGKFPMVHPRNMSYQFSTQGSPLRSKELVPK